VTHDDASRFEQEEPAPLLCPRCESELHYRAEIGAPGFGKSFECSSSHSMIVIGTTIIDPSEHDNGDEPPWILTRDDVR
jgi:hypothetical protein